MPKTGGLERAKSEIERENYQDKPPEEARIDAAQFYRRCWAAVASHNPEAKRLEAGNCPHPPKYFTSWN
ncbi:unnamed protein product [Clonostachys rosea f. rosea IK726]|uniref:Uncharacterized protein n=1 Tax=Clonostachys rosea f. rosea IK726 TaxID=1349383 RepID=A0ACA9USB8_BIOOC|nr:unnamed protein product [Clonostachys rosea f. rosea IK726]